MKDEKKILLSIAVTLCVVIADQVTKALITGRLAWGEAHTILPGLFNIVYYKNTGAAFGIFSSGGSGRTTFLTIVSLVALIIIAVLIRRSSDGRNALALSLIAGGAIGNLIDRIRYGSVVDFLDFHIGTLHWPAFNIADSAITTGVIVMLYLSFFPSGLSSGRHSPRE